MKYCYIDFEFNETAEEKLNLVCCSLSYGDQVIESWLHNSSPVFIQHRIEELSEKGYIFVAYAVEAEARSFIALNLEPLGFKWIDLYLEYRHLLNHNHKLAYGKQLIQGRKKVTKPPKNKWDMTEEDKKKFDMSKPEYNLAAACYKLLDVSIDTVFKDETRDLIISAPKEFTDEERNTIQRYCTSDIKYLPRLLEAILEEYRGKGIDTRSEVFWEQVLARSSYAVRTAIMVTSGYPIDREKTQAFSDAVAEMLWNLKSEINGFFPDLRLFELDSKKHWVWKQENTKNMLRSILTPAQLKRWTRTDKKSLSLGLDAFERQYTFRHDFPRDNPIAQIIRFLKFKRQLNGFMPSNGKRKSFWDSVGSDDRVRPYFGIYGSQSSRSQPSATGFLFLKSAWMRALCVPPKGKAIIGIDYGSQEFLIAALVSRDMNMINAYLSGDPYLAFAKLAGAAPASATKESHPEVRNLFKSTVLGVSYQMGANLLAQKLTDDTGKKVTVDEAQRLINKYNRAFPKYARYRKAVVKHYRKEKKLVLPCGWTLWGDNPNDKSVANFPIQGRGATLMREAVKLAQDRGLDVIQTLHDALYIECDIGTEVKSIAALAQAMYEAFQSIFEGKWKDLARIKLDADIWSPEFKDKLPSVGERVAAPLITGGNLLIPVVVKDIYIDPRSKTEYEKFKKYFIPRKDEDFEI
jgi:hypothetical protein